MSDQRPELTYKSAGVDLDVANSIAKLIKKQLQVTDRPEVMSKVGGFSGLFKLDLKKYKNPVLSSSADGVGTKLKLAQYAERHFGVGIDLVAMCVNDIITCGAEPLFMLDYISTNKIDPRVLSEVISGISSGCQQSGCALIGGETAEMPGFYLPGEYDLAGFAVGCVEQAEIVDGRDVAKGDVLISLSSSGAHSNGYSLIRAVFGIDSKESFKKLSTNVLNKLLEPTIIYAVAVLDLKKRLRIKAMANITGGGIIGNLSRSLRPDVDCIVELKKIDRPEVFDLIAAEGKIDFQEMYRVFNMGMGFAVIVSSDDVDGALHVLKDNGIGGAVAGEIVHGSGKVILRS
ncbi:MAG: phosphoribosylformylglycinamidine cyclo-ligase [Actinobacteria bacterium]|nr:phosphoribosylformylglycinamidine cyclo-ligase [Actinomycetota bacterium]